jgi:hypothetical protein
MPQIYVETVKHEGSRTEVTGYIEGTVRVGTVFRLARTALECRDGKCIALPDPLNPRDVNLRVTKIEAYEKVLDELTGIAGLFCLGGDGGEVIRWGDVLSDN